MINTLALFAFYYLLIGFGVMLAIDKIILVDRNEEALTLTEKLLVMFIWPFVLYGGHA